jgi:feruloyl-CoA synthase
MMTNRGIRTAPVAPIEATFESADDGSLIVRSARDLGAYPDRVTEPLQFWAETAPANVLLAERSGEGWRSITYREAWDAARAIGQALLDRGLDAERPVLILSGNGIEHAMLSLACLHVGVPFAPLSPAYSLVSTDFTKLREIFAVVRPALVFADDGDSYAAALGACTEGDTKGEPEIIVARGNPGREATAFATLLATRPTAAVDAAADAVKPDTVAKLLFTSGSTGSPKGVIHTHRMWCSTVQMGREVFPMLAEAPPVLVDWLPWSHILGGTVLFGCALFNGGTLYIDDGKPLPGQIEKTVRNLREIAPSFYSNVPKGYEELLTWLRRDRSLRENFFSQLRVMQYSGASIARSVYEGFDELALATVGRRIPWIGILGSTEAGPIAAHQHSHAASTGCVGLPVPGVTLKLVASHGKMEVRVRSPSVSPGYWGRDDLTRDAFDEDGFLRTGDGVDWLEPTERQRGLRYDGRIAEDFKLATGTWVRVGSLRAQLMQHLAPEVRDVVVAGENRDYIALLGIPSTPEIVGDKVVRGRLRAKLMTLATQAHGSAQRALRFAFLTEKLSIDTGELTDKGAISQRTILRRHAASVEKLYAERPADDVICLEFVRS